MTIHLLILQALYIVNSITWAWASHTQWTSTDRWCDGWIFCYYYLSHGPERSEHTPQTKPIPHGKSTLLSFNFILSAICMDYTFTHSQPNTFGDRVNDENKNIGFMAAGDARDVGYSTLNCSSAAFYSPFHLDYDDKTSLFFNQANWIPATFSVLWFLSSSSMYNVTCVELNWIAKFALELQNK